MTHWMSSTYTVNLKQGWATSCLHGLTLSSSTHPLKVNQMNMLVSKVSLIFQARGVKCLNMFGTGSHIAQVRVIFKLPTLSDPRLQSLQSKHLAYIKWFSPFRAQSEPHHGFYKIMRDPQPGHRRSAVIEVSAICQSVHLFPCFSGSWRTDWTSDNVLEKCDTFFVNSLLNQQMYLTMS